MMALAVKSDVLKLMGSPSTREQTNLDIDNTLIKIDKMVFEATRKEDWSDEDYGYDWAVEAANKLAAAELIVKFYDPKDRSPIYRKDFEYAISILRRIGFGSTKDSNNPLFQVTVGSYKKNIEDDPPFMSKGVFGEDYFDR